MVSIKIFIIFFVCPAIGIPYPNNHYTTKSEARVYLPETDLPSQDLLYRETLHQKIVSAQYFMVILEVQRLYALQICAIHLSAFGG